MSTFNITDITVAGAFWNAMDAVGESDRRTARYHPPASVKSAKAARTDPTPLTAIRAVIGEALRSVGRTDRTETA